MNKIVLLLFLIPVITFAQEDELPNLFVCDSMRYGRCYKKPYDPKSRIISSRDLVTNIKWFLTGGKSKIDNLANYYLVNGRIDFARPKERDNFYYGLVSLLIDPRIGLLSRGDLEDYIFVWCSEEMLKQIDVVLSEVKTKDDKKIIKKIRKKVQRKIK
jgi:hypothetical protein